MEFNRLMTGNEANGLAVAELSEFVEGECRPSGVCARCE